MTRSDPLPGFTRGLPRTRAALRFATRAHRGQQCSDGTPFIRHPVEVASLLHDSGAPDDLIAAGMLHDIVERTDSGAGELAERFGERVAALVNGVTDDPQIQDLPTRKAELCDRVALADRDVLVLFAADKISKIRELRRAVSRDGWTTDQRQHLGSHRLALTMLRIHLPDSRLVDRLAFELDCLVAAEPLNRPSGHRAPVMRLVDVEPHSGGS